MREVGRWLPPDRAGGLDGFNRANSGGEEADSGYILEVGQIELAEICSRHMGGETKRRQM